MTARRIPPTLAGTVTGGAVIWNGTAWVNTLVDATSLSTAANTRLPRSGTGSPAGVVSAPVGTLYTRTDGGTNTTLYVKESGSGTSGWVAK